MQLYQDLQKRKELVRHYIRSNPTATFKEIKKKIHIKINKVYSGGMQEAYEDAGIKPPRTLTFKTKEERRKILIEYVKNNPGVGGQVIRKETKINFLAIFNNTEEMHLAAGVSYIKKNNIILRNKFSERKEALIDLIRKNPTISVQELMRSSKSSIYHHFKSIKELYQEAGVAYLGKGVKKKIKKQNAVINYITSNHFATQREINRNCKTHVQTLFDRGIFEAYELADVVFPFERLDLHGAALNEIKESARSFEITIANKLAGYGSVSRLVKTERGFADIVFIRKGIKAVVEVKDFRAHEISSSHVRQLHKYLEDIGSRIGFLVCLQKPKRDTFLIGENRIFILTESELHKIPEIMDP